MENLFQIYVTWTIVMSNIANEMDAYVQLIFEFDLLLLLYFVRKRLDIESAPNLRHQANF